MSHAQLSPSAGPSEALTAESPSSSSAVRPCAFGAKWKGDSDGLGAADLGRGRGAVRGRGASFAAPRPHPNAAGDL